MKKTFWRWALVAVVFLGAAGVYRTMFFSSSDESLSGEKKAETVDLSQLSPEVDSLQNDSQSQSGQAGNARYEPGAPSQNVSSLANGSAKLNQNEKPDILSGAMLEQRIEELVKQEFPRGQVQRDSTDGIGSRVVEMRSERGDQVMTMFDPGGRMVMESWTTSDNEITRSYDENGKPFLVTIRQANGVRTEALLSPEGAITSRTEVRDDDYLEQKDGDPLLDGQ